MKEIDVARHSLRIALAGLTTTVVLLTACGHPATVADPMAVPAAAPVTQTPEPDPVEAPPSVEPEGATETPSPSATPQPSATPTATASKSPTAKPAGAAIMKQGDQTERVKELQARLKQIGWFSGQVTGYYGPTTQAAVAGFQGKRGLEANGSVDQATWNALTGMTRKPTADELSDKPATPAPSRTPSTATSTKAGEKKAQGLDSRCMTGRVICISKRSNKVWWVNDGVVQMTMDARFGTGEFRTREGTFQVEWKSRDHVSNIYHTSMPFALFFSGGQAVHYSPDFAARGYNGGSHGCVNLRDRGGAQSLFNQARVGDKVVVYS